MTYDNPVPPDRIYVEPGTIAAYGNGWKQLWKHFWELLLVGLIFVAIIWGISWAVGMPFSLSLLNNQEFYISNDPLDLLAQIWWYYGLMLLLQVFVINHLTFGMAFLFLGAARGDQVELKDLFIAFRNYWPVVLFTVIVTLAYLIAYIPLLFLFALLPVLGFVYLLVLMVVLIIVSCKLAFVPFLLVDRRMKTREAIETSWRWTDGHAGDVFLIALLAIPITILGMLCLFIGIIPAVMWVYMAFASLYHAVSLRKDSGQAPEAHQLPF